MIKKIVKFTRFLYLVLKNIIYNSGNRANPNHQGSWLSSKKEREEKGSSWDLNSQPAGLGSSQSLTP
jgi:hypothetical protein